MHVQPMTRAVAAPGTALCRCFCRHFVTLTGAGLSASARTTAPREEDKDDV